MQRAAYCREACARVAQVYVRLANTRCNAKCVNEDGRMGLSRAPGESAAAWVQSHGLAARSMLPLRSSTRGLRRTATVQMVGDGRVGIERQRAADGKDFLSQPTAHGGG